MPTPSKPSFPSFQIAVVAAILSNQPESLANHLSFSALCKRSYNFLVAAERFNTDRAALEADDAKAHADWAQQASKSWTSSHF